MDAPRPEPDTLTIEEMSARLGISKTLGYELAKHDRLPVRAIRLGRRVVVSRAEVECLLSGSRGRPDGAAVGYGGQAA